MDGILIGYSLKNECKLYPVRAAASNPDWKKHRQPRKLTHLKIKGHKMDCLFCKIANGAIPAKVVYQDDLVLAFDDISPQAPHHKLIIPRKHIATLNDITIEDNLLISHIVQTAKKLAKDLGVAEQGYRLVMNCNAGAGQTVFHIHAHLLGGRQMIWPPG